MERNSKYVVEGMLDLQSHLDSKIREFITEKALKNEITEEDLNNIKDSLFYIIDDKFGHVIRNIK